MAKGKIEQEIALKVTGAKDVKDAEKLVDKFDGKTAEVTIDVDDKASKDIKTIDELVEGLTEKQRTIVLKAQADQAERDIKKLTAQIGRAKDVDTIQVKVDLLDTASDRLAEINSQLEKLDGQTVEIDTRTAVQGVDDLGKSADSSKSVLANMVGNATQDLGALGGLAGSAGVAIGQMGEYMVDASNSGDRFGTVLRNFGKVAGPIALIAGAIQFLSSVVSVFKDEAETAKKRTDDLAKAMADGGDDALGFAEVLREDADALTNFNAASSEAFGDLGVKADALLNKIPLIGSAFGDSGEDVLDIADRAGLSIYELGRAIEDGGAVTGDLRDQLDAARESGKISASEYDALSDALGEYGDSAEAAARQAGLFAIDQAEANATIVELTNQRDPLKRFAGLFKTVMDDMRDGTIDTDAATASINLLSDALGIPPSEVLSMAIDEIATRSEAAAERSAAALDGIVGAFQGVGDAAVAAKQEADAYEIDVSDAQGQLEELVSGFSTIASKSEAIRSIFDLKNAPLEALGQVQDIEQGIRDFAEFVNDPDGGLKGAIPNIFNPDDVNADDFLARIAGLRDPIQQAVTDAFAAGGPDAAATTADTYVQSIVEALGGKLDKEQVEALLGLTDLDATIGVAVKQSEVDKARRQLEILTGIGGETPYTASIALALDAGEITGEQAQALIQPKLEEAGVTIPTGLKVPSDTEIVDVAKAAQRVINEMPPLNIPVSVGGGMFRMANGRIVYDSGGTVPQPGGIAGEKGTEILDGKYLTTGPTWVPPGTRVTSRNKTTQILRSGRHRFRTYDQGGVVPVAPVTNNVNVKVNLPAGADGADVVRQVKRWQRRNGSLL